MQFWGKNIQHPKKNQYSMIEVLAKISSIIVFYNKIYTIKNVSC